MGPNISQERFNKLQPAEKEMFFTNKDLLKMFGITETLLNSEYTKNYDHRTIPLHSLELMAKDESGLVAEYFRQSADNEIENKEK